MRILSVTAVFVLLMGCGSARKPETHGFTQADFQNLLDKLARGLNTGNARLAADCFTEDAKYSSAPDPLVRKGRPALFDYFGGEKGRAQPMSMLWHHVLFDPTAQIGMVEYTFTHQIRTHGVAVIRIVGGKIANWREYEVQSRNGWEEMIGENAF